MRIRWFWYLILAGIVFIGGLAATFIVTFSDMITTDKIAVNAPGKAEIMLPEAGKYTVFYEYKVNEINVGVLNAKTFSKQNNAGSSVQLSITSLDHNEAIPYILSTGTTYQINNRAGESIFEFEIEEAGRYAVIAEAETFTEPVTLTIFPSFGGVFIKAILIIVPTLIVSLLLAILSLVIWSRGRRKTIEEVIDKA